ncbi:hypothetical protein DPMN_098393 [Dreissena polymorpha]|uniref:Uncharacterized protein n=1 Tax=Dreissena polymorpha TaxID=45954 RepID=A0A9D4R6A0_DREPO|nr:hypothetical protein DPMN_098393 [Dreissena polymorpha]
MQPRIPYRPAIRHAPNGKVHNEIYFTLAAQQFCANKGNTRIDNDQEWTQPLIKGNLKLYENCHTITLVSHPSKVMHHPQPTEKQAGFKPIAGSERFQH